jgi:hypothetical protein
MASDIEVIVRKDFCGNDLTIGTKVIFMELGYRNFDTGIITHMSNLKGTITRDNGKKNIQLYTQMIRANHG